MKKSKAVIAAQEALKAKQEQLDAARADVLRLQTEVATAYQAVTDAQIEDDAKLPQCRMVEVWRTTGKESGGAPYVILRQTPTGLLVIRRVGDANGYEKKFKWWASIGVFATAEKQYGYSSTRSELRDVPAQFMPA